MKLRTGGEILVAQLAAFGVDKVFMVPGESFLAALDALYDHAEIRTIVCRHEGGAAMMAEAAGKLGPRPGICFATRGPGAANAMSGLHVAEQDQTPMILFVGLPASQTEDRNAFQEIDVSRLFSSFVKWAAVIRTPDRIPEYLSRAFHVAMSGRPGPVVLGLPENMLTATAAVRDATSPMPAAPAASADALSTIAERLRHAERPVILVGGPGWCPEAQTGLEAFAARFDIPVAAAFRAQDYVDNRSPYYAGHAGIAMEPTLSATIRDADVVLAIGTRLDEITTSAYTLLSVPSPDQFLIHTHPSPDELGRVYSADLSVPTTSRNLIRALAGLSGPPRTEPRPSRIRARAAYESHGEPRPSPGSVDLGAIVRLVSERLPADAIITNGAGNYAAFLHRHFVYKGYRTQLAPASGSMGYGLPAAIAAKLAHPDRPVIAWAGDGCFLMTGQELATAVQYGLRIIAIVANNGIYGTIRMHQERTYPGRPIASGLTNPDFAALARSFGAHAEKVTVTGEFAAAFERALAADAPALIELMVDPEAIAPSLTLSGIARETQIGGRTGPIGK